MLAGIASVISPNIARGDQSGEQAARQAVIQAYEAVNDKQWKVLDKVAGLASTDPMLGDFATFWQLRQQLHDTTQPIPQAALQSFMAHSRNAHLKDRLTGDWIIATVRAGDYQAALDLGPTNIQTAPIGCATVLAQHMTGQSVSAEQAREVFSPGTTCWSMMDQLAKSEVLSWEDWQFELRAILETSQTNNARRMAAIMFSGAEMKDYSALMENPKQWLRKQNPPGSRADTALITLALSRLARGDRAREAAYLEDNWAQHLPADAVQWVYSQFGLIAALRVESDAAKWYRRSGDQRLTDYNHAWEVRAELRETIIDWERVRQAVNRMTDRQASEPVWVYWKARALEALGEKEASMQLYASIKDDLSFYGQLANEELGHTPFIPDLPDEVSDEELQEARDNWGLQVALEAFRLGWRTEGIQQWSYALRGLNDRQLLAAAEFAREQEVFDRVVNTSLLTKEDIDFRQRFVAPFHEGVIKQAEKVALDPAWVYGLIRQESRFMTDVRSHAGASGLMQLMPDTARWVANKIGLSDFKPSQVNDFEVNTALGTNYLRMVLDRLEGSEVLASAGYNAGPKRPIRWRSRLAKPVEGAIFAETIPFTETRLYVKNVMSNTVYYAMMFTQEPQYLKKRLGVIAPKSQSSPGLP